MDTVTVIQYLKYITVIMSDSQTDLNINNVETISDKKGLQYYIELLLDD